MVGLRRRATADRQPADAPSPDVPWASFAATSAMAAGDSRRDLPSVIVVNGMQCVLAVSDADKSRFLGRTLDYRNGQFVLD